MPRKKKKPRQDWVKNILLNTLHAADNLTTVAFNVRGVWRYQMSVDDFQVAQEVQTYKRAIERLKKQKLVLEKKLGDRIILSLTEAGKSAAFKKAVSDINRPLPKGLYCLVTYDIPESQRPARRVIRDLLKGAGFKVQHQSLWIGTNDLYDELNEIIRRLGVQKWIDVYLAKKK